MYEILLTRIFSVTMWYHYAFVAVSIAMFGLTLGALIVFLFPDFFTNSKTDELITYSTFIFSISIIFSFLTHLSIPFISNNLTITGVFSIGLNYIVISIPFTFSGISISLLLSRYKSYVSKLYAFDLVGAGLGCILFILIINNTDGPNAIFYCSIFACLSAIIFGVRLKLKRFKRILYFSFSIITLFTIINTYLSTKQKPLIRLMWVKGELETQPLYEKWNSYSRIRAIGNPNVPEFPYSSGLSSRFTSDTLIYQIKMDIDANAATYLTRFGGNLDSLKYLKYDVTNIVHQLKKDAKVCVIGSGGGRDILSALVFKQKEIIGIEINNEILEAVNKFFGAFTGHLNDLTNVKFVNDEARSYITRSKDSFDIIQVSLIDTWAATAAGAFVLAENSIYTVEAWKEFLNHLTFDGILTFSRWYMKDNSGEMYRLASISSTSLRHIGIKDPHNNIVIIRNRLSENSDSLTDGIGTLLTKRTPFSSLEIEKLNEISKDLDFEILYCPLSNPDNIYYRIIDTDNYDKLSSFVKVNIQPPTDDNPFFFQMLKLNNIFSFDIFKRHDISRNLKAVLILFVLLLIVAFLTFVCLILPLIFIKKDFSIKKVLPFVSYFFAIGIGFMLIEMTQMQRLIIFLGHPTYSLTVVLFSLLLSSGIGSYLTEKIDITKGKTKSLILSSIIVVLLLFAILTPSIIEKFRGESTSIRIAFSLFILIFIGFFMGSAFPIGIKSLSLKSSKIVPWLWGINGSATVLASVLAVFISIFLGISFAFYIGILCYIIAFISSFFWKEYT